MQGVGYSMGWLTPKGDSGCVRAPPFIDSCTFSILVLLLLTGLNRKKKYLHCGTSGDSFEPKKDGGDAAWQGWASVIQGDRRFFAFFAFFAWLARFCALTFEPRSQWPEFSKGCTMYTALTDRLQTSSFPFQAGWYLKRSLERLPQSTSNQQTRPEIKTWKMSSVKVVDILKACKQTRMDQALGLQTPRNRWEKCSDVKDIKLCYQKILFLKLIT